MPEIYFIASNGELLIEDLMDGCLQNIDQNEYILQFSTGIIAEYAEEIDETTEFLNE